MITLGDKIRDAIIDKHGKKDELKTVTMKRAASMVGMSKSYLYQKLNAEKIDVDLLDMIQKELGIDVNTIIRDHKNSAASNINSSDLKEYTFRVKSGEAKVYLPNGSDKEDVKTLIQYLNLFEKNF